MYDLRQLRTATALAIVAVGLGLVSVAAQDTESSRESEPSGAEDATSIERANTTILFVRDDETGRLLPVFDLTLKELARLKRLQDDKARDNNKPRFHFAEATITGSVEKEKASLKLVYDIVAHESGWTRVPMDLGDTVIVSAEFEGSDEQFLEYDDAEANYFAWINSNEENSIHRVTINLLTRVSTVGNEQRLALKLPRVIGSSNTPSMTLKVPVEAATAFANSGGQACPVETRPTGKSTELKILQPAGDFTVSWRSTKRRTSSATPVVFDTSSEIIVHWDSQSRLTWNANISLSVRSGELATAIIDLPAGARLVEQDVAGQRVSIIETEDASNRVRVSIQFDRPVAQRGVKNVRLTCEHQLIPTETGSDPVAEIAGFRVEGAARQSGFIGMTFSEVWRPRISELSKVHRIYQMPSGFREAGVLGSNSFQFLGQPCSLKVAVSTRQRRVLTESTHLLDVTTGRLTLEARIRYTISGRHLDICSGIFPGWEIEGIELIEDGGIEPIDFLPPTESRLDIDLPREMRGEFELRIVASQAIPDESDFFVVNLPTIEEEHRRPPELIVVADDQLEILADLDRSLGLSETDDPARIALPERQYPPQVFLINNETTSFAAEINRRARQVTVSSQASVRVSQSSLSMEQTLLYHVRHETVNFIELEIPPWWTSDDVVRVTIDGEQVRGTTTSSEAEADRANLVLPLPKSRLGAIEVTVTYEIATSELPPGESTTSTIFFARPAVADYVAPFSLSIDASAEIAVRFAQDDLKPIEEFESDNSELQRYKADSIPTSCDLLLTYERQRVVDSTVIERVWIQTWLTSGVRQDRAVFRLSTNRSDILIEIPSPARTQDVMLLVDGQAFDADVDESGLLRVTLPKQDSPNKPVEPRTFVIEIGWKQVQSSNVIQTVSCDVPVVQDAWLKEVRWNLLTPRNQFVLTTPPEMTGELLAPLSWWQQNGQPSQRDFERWVGASSQPSPETISQSPAFRRYSFASIGLPERGTAICVSGSFSALIAIGLTLGCGGAFLHFRRLRHPGVVLAVGLALVGLAITWPAVALVAGQAIVLIIVVVLLWRLLQLPFRQLRRQRGRSRRVTTPASAIRVRPSTRIHTEPVLNSPSTTANGGPALPMDTSP